MADAELLALLRRGTEPWNAWKKQNFFAPADLSWADLSEARLPEVDLGRVNLIGADLSNANLNEANLSGADLSHADLVRANFMGADLTGCRVYGISAWDLKLDGAKQENLIITPHYEAEITVDNLEVAQFIYLLLNNERIRHVIDTITSKVVLILGGFQPPERKAVLDALREAARLHSGAVRLRQAGQQDHRGDHLDARSHGAVRDRRPDGR
jgi:hypothetical protein